MSNQIPTPTVGRVVVGAWGRRVSTMTVTVAKNSRWRDMNLLIRHLSYTKLLNRPQGSGMYLTMLGQSLVRGGSSNEPCHNSRGR
jgi:hypothetical protein